MIVLDCEQGSEEWHLAKLGVISASNFGLILTSTGKESTQAKGYMNKLIAETLLKARPESFKSEWMERGNEMEPQACEDYEFITDKPCEKVGFIYKDERKLIGCSPDRLTEASGLEVKCPAAHTHIEYLLANKVPAKYLPQVQGCMYVTGRDTWDFMSYYPGLKPLIVTVSRDEEYLSKLDKALDAFCKQMKEKLDQLKG